MSTQVLCAVVCRANGFFGKIRLLQLTDARLKECRVPRKELYAKILKILERLRIFRQIFSETLDEKIRREGEHTSV